MKTKFVFKRVLTLVLAVMMLVTAMPVGVLADPGATGTQDDKYLADDYSITYNDKIIRKADYINKVENLPIEPKKTENAGNLIKNPAMPKLYTVHADFKVQRGDDLVISYQPYIATAGEAISQDEKDKINKEVKFPNLDGYTSATPNRKANIVYKFIKDKALAKNNLVGDEFKGHFDYIYTPITSTVKIKHLFQDINDFNKYTNPDGTITQGDTIIEADGTKKQASEAEIKEHERITTQHGVTGTSLTIQPLSDNQIKGYVPEGLNITTQVPENPDNFVIELRYNLAHYAIKYDTAGGTEIPARTLYFRQVIPKIADADIPTKVGGDFLGWKPSVDLTTKDGTKTYRANEIIAVGTGQAIKNLGANLIMPAEDVTFTAVWKEKEKADYAVQFWVEKADHADGASLQDKYEYMGTRVYKDKDTGLRPDLDKEPVNGLKFPDLDQARLNKIWGGARFNRGHDLYLNKFFVYNQDLTHEQNKDPKQPTMTKAVSATGKTVYNIYYDRQVYELYFTKSNAQPAGNTFYPEIWGYDEAKGEVVRKGGPGNPYHYKARFNQLMLGWPNDAMQTKGFSKGMQSFGWGPNYNTPNWPGYLDTPPYRLNADEFLDMPNYIRWGGYEKPIDKGDGTSIDLKWFDYTILSFGIKQEKNSMPHHMDFWMDGFKPDETIIRYDLYRYKADTNSDTYAPKYPQVQGFTGKRANERPDYFDSDGIDEKNDERADVTPFPAKTYTDMYGERPVGMMKFIKAFLNNGDEWGDPDGWDGFDKNGYLKFEYSRNKYPLRFNYDPSKIKGDNEFNSTNQLDTFYEFPLKCLSPDVDTDEEYKKVAKGENPSNLLDNPENLQKLSLTDLVFNDKNDNNKLKVKRPDNLSDQMVFKGWALDPAGSKLIWENPGEKMPSHPVNLYAKWGEPDYKWKVTFDPDGGVLENINEEKLTQERKTIQEGDIGQIEVNTYAKKEANDGDKQVFTVIQRQKLVEPKKPTKRGYEFMGWEVIHYTKDADGNYTSVQDTSYRDTYKVPELYSFGNDVVSPVYLKAIWVKSDVVDIKSYHHFLNNDYEELTAADREIQVLRDRRVGSYLAAVGSRQNAERILVPKDEWEKLEKNNTTELDDSMTYAQYRALDKKNPRVNSYNQQIRIEQEKIQDPAHPNDPSKLIDNPINQFHFYYRPFRKREYKVNYLDVRAKDKIETIFEIRALKKEIPKLKIQIKRASDKAEKEKLEDIKKKKEKRLEELEKKPTESLVTLSKNYAIIDQETVTNGNRDFDARNYRHIPGWVLADGEKPQQQLFFDVNEETNELLGINGTGSDEIYFFYKDVRVVEVPGDKEPPTGYVRVTFKADNGGSFGKDDKGNDIKELHYDVIKGFRSDNLLVPQVLKTGEEKDSKKYYITPDNGKNFIEWTDSKLLNSDTILEKNYSFTAKFDWSGLSSSGLVTTESFKDSNNTWTNNFAPKIEDLKKQLVWRVKEEEKPLPEGTEIKFFNEAGKELTSDEDVFNLLLEKKAADKEELVRTVNITAKVNFKDKKDTQELNIPIKIYKNVYEALNKDGDKPLFLTEAEKKDAKDGGLKDVTGNYVKVTVAPTGDMDAKDNKVYYVNPKAWVEIPEVKADGSSSFINWTADQAKQNEDEKANGKFDFAKRHKFTDDTVISPRFSQTNELVVYESYKDSKNNWVNDFISSELTETKLKEAVHVKDAKGNIIALGDGDTVTIVDDDGNPYADETALKDALYKKLKEIPDGKVSRTENIKVKVRFANGETQTLDIPVKVIKNIYEAKTEAGKPNYVPANYVKVTFDPTTKAKDPQKYFYYVNPDAKVQIPGKDPVGAKEDFTGWTIKADSAAADEAGTAYKLNERHQFEEASTITAQYGQGKAKIKYVDENKNEIAPKYRIDGVDYPAEKIGMLGDNIPDPGYNQDAEKAAAPKFKGYIISGVTVDRKPANYTDPATATITYQYYKKVITDTPTNPNVYFPVIFNANGGEFESDPKDKKTVYVYFDGNNATVEKVTFEELRQAVEEKYGKPSKANENFIEWQNNKNNGLAVDDAYEIKFKGWNWDADPDNGYVPEIFYANYGKVSANIAYLDLDGKPIADEFKFLTDAEAQGLDEAGKKAALDKKYPTEKAGTADDAIDKNVYTAETAPKFTGYKFNRIELNPKNGKYALKDKATIKIYYEKDLDVIPAKDVTEKPDGYVEVKFVPTDNAKDKTEKIFYVNPKKEVTIPIANPEGAQYFTFKEWKMGANADGAVYKPSAAQKFTDALTVITATYESSENIIPYNPSATDPMPRPDGYVRVSFAADDGIKLKEQKAYYVKKNAGITLGNADLAKPTYEPQTGYEFSNWDKEDTLEIKDDNILVTAKAKVLADFDTVTHPGYVKVTFKAGENGVIKENGNEINEKVYYVNPNKYVNLKAPTPVADTGYEFAAWSKPGDDNFSLANFIKYPNETTITAKFNLVNTVIPIIDGKPSKPKNFVKVTFKFDANSEGHGNLIGTKEYYVDSTQAVTLTPPTVEANIGYKFNKWSQDANTATKYEEDTIIECKLEKLDDIIKAKEDDTDDAIPHGYVLVYFYAGNQGTAKGQAMYYVNPKAGKTIKDLTKPEVTEKTGYKFIKWDTDDNEDIKDNKVIYAAYEELDDKILVTPGVQQPDGYVKVTFAAGENGRIDARSYYVNPNKYVKLDPPATYPAQNYEFSLWDPDVRNFTRYKKDTTITAKFRLKELVITKTDPNATVPSGYIELNFIIDEDSKGRGNLEGNTSYFVKKDVLVTINPPRPNPNIGFKFVEWDFDTTEPKKYSTGKTIKASFTGFDPILPSTDDKGTTIARPQGYVVVHFLNGEHGRLSGETIYYVNPKAGKTLKDIAQKPSVIEDTGYVFDKWSEDESTAIKKDLTIKAQYTERPDIITAGPDQTAPRGYVVIIFKTDGNGTMTSRIKDEYGANAKNVHEIVYFVNPNKKIKLTKGDAGPNLLPVPDTKPNDNYDFDGWFNDIDEEKPIIRGRVHVAKFKPAKVKLTYFANGADGTPPAELEVNHNTSVRLAGPGNLKKTDAKFLGWKIGDDTNLKQAGDEIILTEDTKAVAQWKNDKKIIEYNPEEPTTRPDGYLRVTFAADDGLKLTEQKAYYVKKGTKLADIKKNNEYGYPSVGPKTGYKFDDKWDEGKTIEINGDTVVTAKSTKLGTVIPATGAPNEKPNGYKEVTFVVKAEDAAKGSITGVAKFYVNPTEYVTITSPPTAKAETGFEFGGWNPNPSIPTVYKEDTTIKGSFNGLKDVIPKTKTNDSEKPAGYKTVTFVIDPDKGGSIVKDEVTVYYVNPAKEVTVPQPKTLAETGYEFEKWRIEGQEFPTEAKKYDKDTTVKGNFKKLDDIVDGNKPKPDGYVKVTFISETNGKLKVGDKKVYYVNPKSRTLGDLTTPDLIPDIGFEEDSWDILGVGAYNSSMSISEDMIINAKYKPLADVVPRTRNDRISICWLGQTS